jgi:hypothetical protein
MKNILLFVMFFSFCASSSYAMRCNYVEGSLILAKCEKCEGVKVCIAKVECDIDDKSPVYGDVVCMATANNQCPDANHCLEDSNSGNGVNLLIKKDKGMSFKLCDKTLDINQRGPFDYQNRRICDNGQVSPYGGKVGTLPSGAIGENGATGGGHTGSIGKAGGAGLCCGAGTCPTKPIRFKKK